MKWLDRALMVSPYYYGLCLSEKDLHKELKRLNVPKNTWPAFLASASADATTHFLERGDGGLCAIVTLGTTKGRSVPQIHAMLVHEATHLWQAIRDNIGEKSPSSEFEAYAVQSLSQRLMESYSEQRKKAKTK